MQIDKITLTDLSIFDSEEEFSIFHRLNFTRTIGGKAVLKEIFSTPHNDLRSIEATQQVIRLILEKEAEWPAKITNGTIMVIERFYESNIDTIPENASVMSAWAYRSFHSPDFSLVRYSVGHFADFVQGFHQLLSLFEGMDLPDMLMAALNRARKLLDQRILDLLAREDRRQTIRMTRLLDYGHYLLYHFKSEALELIEIYSRLDAYYSMALAVKNLELTFPKISNTDQPFVEVKGLYHILLEKPVSYQVQLDRQSNFLFLTGANMAGKSTFIKAVGTAVYLAHLGMGVPAEKMELSLFDGLLSNIQVMDNIVKGESFFFNEVQRIKNTIIKINDGSKWLVLIDELFKGTNVQDAMKCSSTVIEGLLKIRNTLFILSTHLYEIGEDLRRYPNISFRFFETSVAEEQLYFSYQLKEGISNDRLGYLILKQEKVVELLERL